MQLEKLRFATYLEEASDDPQKSCDKIRNYGIKAICLKRTWTSNVCNLSDGACAILRDMLGDLEVALICSSVGDVPVNTMSHEYEHLDRAISICRYFNCKYLRLSLGRIINSDRAVRDLEKWMGAVSDITLSDDIMPTFELCHNYNVDSPVGFSTLLSKFGRWSIIYDPAALIMHRKLNPFTKYWSLLKDRASHIDIHDYKIGDSPRPPGHGDGKIDLVLGDAIASNFGGWYCLEPGLGRRHGNIITRENTFEHSYKALEMLLSRLDIGQPKEVRNG
jgi:sugar phosphate isomerase/epimerase